LAQKVITTIIDDISNEEITDGDGGTVRFSFDGAHYEIDLSTRNADAFRKAVSEYVAAERKVGRGTRTATTAPTRSDPDELARIRAWANENGHEVSARGRIAQSARDAYAAAH